MSAGESMTGRSVLQRWRDARIRVAYAAGVALFLAAVAQFHRPDTGFTSLLSIGDQLDGTKVTALQQVPHYVYEDSAGYDGAYYAQLALHPTLDNPELATAIDNLPYRGKRILFSWTAWLLGLGQPAWILQAYALLNVGCWLALACVLWRWLPPTSGNNLLRWAAVMFSHGVCMSVRHSLVDVPSLLLIALAVGLLERGRPAGGVAVIALSGLGKETNLLGVAGMLSPVPLERERRAGLWRRARLSWLMIPLLAALPLLAWMGCIRMMFGPAEDPGWGNFSAPLAGLAEKWGAALAAVRMLDEGPVAWATVAATLGLTVQGLFFLLWRRPAEAWWRIGAAFVAMMFFLSTPVWEGYPGAATRVLLPMTLAFNVLVPRGRRWLPVLLAGNLTVVASWFEFTPPLQDFLRLNGRGDVVAAVAVTPGAGWYGPEERGRDRWRWSSGDAVLRVENTSGGPLRIAVRGRAAAPDARELQIRSGETALWAGRLTGRPTDFQFAWLAPPGETRLLFSSERAARTVDPDPRALSFHVLNLELTVSVPDAPR